MPPPSTKLILVPLLCWAVLSVPKKNTRNAEDPENAEKKGRVHTDFSDVLCDLRDLCVSFFQQF